MPKWKLPGSLCEVEQRQCVTEQGTEINGPGRNGVWVSLSHYSLPKSFEILFPSLSHQTRAFTKGLVVKINQPVISNLQQPHTALQVCISFCGL